MRKESCARDGGFPHPAHKVGCFRAGYSSTQAPTPHRTSGADSRKSTKHNRGVLLRAPPYCPGVDGAGRQRAGVRQGLRPWVAGKFSIFASLAIQPPLTFSWRHGSPQNIPPLSLALLGVHLSKAAQQQLSSRRRPLVRPDTGVC